MILMQAFLPRFLVLEVLLFLHFLDHGEACNKRVKKVGDAVARAAGDILSCHEDGGNSNSDSDDLPTCGVDLQSAPPKNMPLFTTPAGELLFPVKRPDKGPDVRWLAFPQADVQVHCPGSKLEATGTPGAVLVCVQDSSFFLGTQDVAFKNLSCSRSIREKVVRTKESCGPSDGDGRMLEIGWQLTDGPFVPQISVCFDQDEAATHYARHVIRGAHIGALNDDPGRPSFKEGRGLYPEISADASYKVAQQEKVLKQLLGASKGASIFSKNKSFLAKGHLAPDADFVWKEWQDATYYFANAAPQWQPFNNGNWKAVEAEVRHFAE